MIRNIVLNLICGFLALEEDDYDRYNVNPIINTLTTVGGFYRSFIGKFMCSFFHLLFITKIRFLIDLYFAIV